MLFLPGQVEVIGQRLSPHGLKSIPQVDVTSTREKDVLSLIKIFDETIKTPQVITMEESKKSEAGQNNSTYLKKFPKTLVPVRPTTMAGGRDYPEFLKNKLLEYSHRINEEWNGSHVLEGYQDMLQPNAILMCSNDYLSLARETRLRRIQADSVLNESGGSFMSPIYMYALQNNPITKFEKKFAQFLGTSDGILAQSGFAANSALIQTLAGPNVIVYMDAAIHMSFVMGTKLVNAKRLNFRHNDAMHAQRLVAMHGPGIIVVETVYSNDGSTCPIQKFVEISEKTGSILIVDESHSIGTHGPDGKGVVVQLGLADRVDFRTFSLAKAFANRAGFITCNNPEFKDFFMSNNFPIMFSSCIEFHDVAWLNAVLDFLRDLENRRERVRRVSKHFRQQVVNMGFQVAKGSEQIVAFVCGTEAEAHFLDRSLQECGIFGSLFVSPAAPKDAPFVRLSINFGLSDEQIERVLEACRVVRIKILKNAN